jgi:PTH1 family peptidyl-tRNA hydrolase
VLTKRPVPTSKQSSPMIVIGLGNPGPRYERTRHNVGYHVADFLMQEPPLQFRRRLFRSYSDACCVVDTGKRPLILVRYNGYMNRSGEVIPSLLRKYDVSAGDLIVVIDNMDLKPGVCRLKQGGGDAGHNGLKSIIRVLGNGDFSRLYIGVGRPAPGISVVDHVLGIPDGSDAPDITMACLRGAASIRDLTHKTFGRVMEDLNRRES